MAIVVTVHDIETR